MSILVLQHHDVFPPTLLLKEAEALGHRLRVFNVADGDLPSRDLAGVDALILCAGPYSMADASEFPWLRREMELVDQAVAADIPVIGIGFGARVLAVALGGQERQLKHHDKPWAEIGWAELFVSEEATKQGPFKSFPARLEVLHFHTLEVTPPPEATVLASSALCECQAFSVGDKHFGLLFHMEMVESDVAMLADTFAPTLESMGLSKLTLGMDLLRRLQHLELYASLFFGRILDRLDGDSR